MLAYDRKIAAIFVAAAAARVRRRCGWSRCCSWRSRAALPRARSTRAAAGARQHPPARRADAERRAVARARPRAAGHRARDRRQSAPPVLAALPDKAPSFFFVDIQSPTPTRFDAFVRTARAGRRRSSACRCCAGASVSATASRAEDLKAPPNAAWVLQSDRGITYAADVPAGSRVVEGEWWGPDYQGPPLVSFEKKIADGLGLKIGDPVVVNVLGRNITATLANLRAVDWQIARHQFRAGVFARRLPRRAAHPYRDPDLSGRRHASTQEIALLKAVAATRFRPSPTVRVQRSARGGRRGGARPDARRSAAQARSR